MTTIDWPPPARRKRARAALLAIVALLVLGGGTMVSFYVDSLWYGSLGFEDVFWTSVNFQARIFLGFALVTFAVLYASVKALRPARLGELAGGTVLINGQPVRIPLEPAIQVIGLAGAAVVGLITGVAMAAQWDPSGIPWRGPRAPAAAAPTDPIFGRPLSFYLFTLPVWQLVSGWLTTMSVIIMAAAAAFAALGGGTRLLEGRRRPRPADHLLRGVCAAFAVVLLAVALRTYLGRYALLYEEHRIFSGITYVDANVTVTGLLIVAILLVIGAAIAAAGAVARPQLTTLGAAVAPAALGYLVVSAAGWYVASFIVRPNELVRESPYIAHNIELTRRAYALDRIESRPFPAETGVEAVEVDKNRDTLENIRLWDWRALQDTLRQIQEIRTYYDFPDVDIDRYTINGRTRQVMLAVRELNVSRLPETSRNWINERLIYTHGYGITMNPVNGFTTEGMPQLLLSNMPVQSTIPGLQVTRPEVYFGELTNTDVYVNTGQQEFNYPQGDTASVTSYEGTGGVPLGGLVRRLLIALDRGDLTRLPFSDDITAESRLLMRRNIRERVSTLAPFLTLDPDPYIVLGDDGRLMWMLDGFTTSSSYPYSRRYRLDRQAVNYLRNSVKVTIDAYNGTVAFYVFDEDDPVLAAYRGVFPSLFRSKSEMPADLRSHVRYPELLLEMQAAVFGLYHITDPATFYNHEDEWSVASEVATNERREQAAQFMEPNFVLMRLPGEAQLEFVEVLPLTPRNRNNLIGWLAGRSDDPNYGQAILYTFPKNRLVDGPLQIEARIDQNPELSSQLTLWDQQGSNVRRGGLIVIPVGRALLFAEPIYLQAERSPMPELRIVVLALQEKLGYGPTFEAALAALFGASAPSPSGTRGLTPSSESTAPRGVESPEPASDDALISGAARDLEEYQRLTAEGKLGEAGQRLEALKRKLEQLTAPRR
jgi:uncharacterized membrane protein (UPF0182 family)